MHELMGKSLKHNHRFTYILWFLQLIGPMFYDPPYLKGVMLGVIQGPGTNKILTNPSRVEGPIFLVVPSATYWMTPWCIFGTKTKERRDLNHLWNAW